jgi:hypothetical protein
MSSMPYAGIAQGIPNSKEVQVPSLRQISSGAEAFARIHA